MRVAAGLEVVALEVAGLHAACALLLLLVVGGHLGTGCGAHIVVDASVGGVVDAGGDRRGLRPLRGHEGTRFVVGRRRQRQILARRCVYGSLLRAVARCYKISTCFDSAKKAMKNVKRRFICWKRGETRYKLLEHVWRGTINE